MREKHNIGYYLVTIACLLVNLSLQDSCTISQTRKLQEQYSQCSQKFTETFHVSAGSDVCELLDNIVDTCVELFSTCHSPRDLRRMKDRHIVQLMDQYSSDGDLTKCRVVREYRDSGRDDPEHGEEAGCNDEESLAAQTGFQQCSHSTSTKVYQSILDMEEPKLEAITDTLCKGLSTIGTLCAKSLTECFAESDFVQIRKSHLAEMKKFFIGFSPELTTSSLDNCKILDYTEVEEVTEAVDPPTTTTIRKTEETTEASETTTEYSVTENQSVERSVDSYDDYYEDYNYDEDYNNEESEYERVRNILSRDGEVSEDDFNANNPSSDPRASTEAAERLQFTRSSSASIHSVMSILVFSLILLHNVTPLLL